MANFGTPNTNGSQFYITLADNISYLDKKNTVFGEVVEGFDVLDKLNNAYCDQHGRPYQVWAPSFFWVFSGWRDVILLLLDLFAGYTHKAYIYFIRPFRQLGCSYQKAP